MVPQSNNLRPMRPRSFAAALACALAAAAAAVHAAPADREFAPYSRNPELRVEALTAPDAAPRLRLRGMWPTPCLPSVENVSLAGSELRIELRSKRPLCARSPLPFDLEVNLAKTLGKTWPAAPLRVSVAAANSATAEAQPRGFALLEPVQGTRAVPASGLWWPLPETNTADPTAGTGFSMEVQGDTIAVAVLGRTLKGAAIWYFGTGTLRGRTARLDVVAAGSAGEGAAAGDNALLQLDFESNGRATAWLGHYDQGDGQPLWRQQKIVLAHLPFADYTDGSNWHGDWVLLGATPGQPRSARQLRLNGDSFISAANYRLGGDDGSILSCERDPQASKLSPPQRCRLSDAQGGVIADFDSIDINRLDGHAPDRTPVQLLRVQRR
jgi:hypothetical protein